MLCNKIRFFKNLPKAAVAVTTSKCYLSDDSSFQKYLQSKIKMKGPITVAEYMREALGNPKWGYYMKKDVFGREGDFITSPEVSQMFGELIGVWYLNEWHVLKDLYKNDLPDSIQFIELGPGRGTLMSDILRVFQKSKISSNINVYMIETSEFLRRKQCQLLCNKDEKPNTLEKYKYRDSDSRVSVTWLDDITQLPKDESVHYFVANEFFDALPIHKFKKVNDVHREVMVDFDEKENKLKYMIAPKVTTASRLLYKFDVDFQKAEHVEFSMESARIMEAIVARLFEYNGTALIIDYGYYGQTKDTFRAFKSHKVSDPLDDPGDSDLTADVDFLYLKKLATRLGATCYGPTTQSDFLLEMQISTRLKILLSKCKNSEEQKNLLSQYDMLINKEKMGERFKVLAVRKLDFKQALAGFSKTCTQLNK